MIDRPVAFIDSGIGGIPYLQWFRKECPGENLVYCADTANFPYGLKPAERVRSAVISMVGDMVRILYPKLFVVACNTAAVSTLADLREKFTVPFVGVVPAVKPAAALTRTKTIGIMATDRTVGDAYTTELISDFASDCRILRYSDGEIVDFVERRLFDGGESEREAIMERAVSALKDADTVVLACTHFLHIKDHLIRAFGPEVTVVDSVEGVGRQTVRVLSETGLLRSGTGTARFYTTGAENGDIYRNYAGTFHLEYKGPLSS